MNRTSLSRLALVCAIALTAACNGSHRTYVLVHGAWMGAWCWTDVAAALRARGDTVITVDLPAHGDDTTPLPGATLDAYVARVTAAVDSSGEPVVLVGHSMGGVVVTQVAENDPSHVAELVYVGAFVPADGQSLLALAMTDADSHLNATLVVDMEHGILSVPQSALDDDFLADGTDAERAALHAHYRDEPAAPFATPVHTTAAGWGSVRKAYVYTAQDHAISLAAQHRMTTGLALSGTATLDTSHSPFLSQPETLAATLASL